MKMKLHTGFALMMLVFLATTGAVIAQSTAEEMLEAGVYKEEVNGDLEGAIEVYEQLLAEYADNRPIAARALLHLGASYEKLGNLKAEDAYERLIAEFGDQASVVSEARMRLQQIRYRDLAEGIQDKGTGPIYRIALDDDALRTRQMAGRQYDFSPSGDQIVYQTWDGISISDASGTLNRLLVKQSDDKKDWYIIYFRVGQPRWSPDGQQIAYFAAKARPPGEDYNDQIFTIFIIDAEGGKRRQLVEYLDPAPFGGLCWSKDGENLSYLSLDGVQVLDLEGNKVNQIEFDMMHHSTRMTGYSPDERWVTLQRKADPESGNNWNTDIYIVPTAGGDAVQVTFESGYDGNPVWSNDGRSLYFVSGRNAEGENSNLWKIKIDEKTGNPIGEPEQVTFFSDALIIHPQLVGDGSILSFLLQKTKHSIHVAPDGQPDDYNTVARGLHPQLSPDGRIVYYVGEGPNHQGIFSVSADGSNQQRLAPDVPIVSAKDISPDGNNLAYFKSLVDDERGLFSHPIDGGEPILLTKTGCDECCAMPRFSPDGKLIAYTYVDGLFVISPFGGRPKQLATLKGWEAWTIRWSPDGKYIAALGYAEGEENNAVYVVAVEGGEPRLISDFDEYKEGLEWHPDGQRLTYHESKSKSDNRITYLDGRPPELFLDDPNGWDYTGIWAPDGERFFFSSAKDEDWSLKIYDTASGEITKWVQNPYMMPEWSNDGKTITWTTEKQIRQLWLMENFK